MRGVIKRRLAVLGWIVALAAHGANIPGIVTNWGDTSNGLTNPPTGLLTGVTAVSCGLEHNLALKADGTVVGWGAGTNTTGLAPNYGQSIIPATLSTNIVTAIASGSYHNIALATNGSVTAWGYNGDGETVVPATVKNIIAIAAGSLHNLAVKADGTVISWGYNGSGQTNVPTGLTNVVAVAGGNVHSLALLTNGTVVAWGNNTFGQTNIPAGLSNVVAIAAGQDHNLALRNDGTVIAWGYDGSGQTNVPAGLSNVVAVAAGGSQSVAITSNGAIVAWGAISNFPSGISNVTAIAAGGSHGLAVTATPILLSQPPSSILLAPGGSTNLTVSVSSGSPVAYQWFFNGSAIAGATTSMLAISNFTLANAGAYTVTISNVYNALSTATVLRLSNSPAIFVNGLDVGGGTASNVDSVQITMTNNGSGFAIYYTLDGSVPDFTATAYNGAFVLTNTAIINAIAYNSNYTSSVPAAPITLQILPSYPLVYSTAGGGSIAVSPAPLGGGNYVSNTVVTLTATPSNGWSFLGWTGGVTTTSNGLTFALTTPRTVQAVFGTPLSLVTNGNGQLQLNPSNGPYAYGSAVQITALPATNSYFFGWAGLASGFTNPLSVVVNNTNGLTALFGTLTSNKVSLVVEPIGAGTVSVSPFTNVFTNGQTITLSAFSASNFVFSNWGGGAAGTSNPLVLVLNGSELITATFVPGVSTNAPVITAPPLSRTLGPGTSSTLSVQASGAGPFSYQWFLDGGQIAAATNPFLKLTNMSPSQAGFYKVSVTANGGAVTSAPASVALFDLVLAPGGTQTFPLLILNGAPGASFQLQYATDLGLTNWSLLEGVTLEDDTGYYIDTPPTNSPRRFYRAVPQ